MKELSIEEKAKRYDTALEIAKEYFKANQKIGDLDENDTLLGIFPELKESEDEKIKNWIVAKLTQTCRNATGEEDKDVVEKYYKACAWLEKQGEQKPTDKVESKFKVGDWVSNGACTWRIDLIENDLYCNNCDKFTCGGDIKSIDEQYHLWTIKDAKDGDVLCVNNEVFIYAHKKQMYPIAVAHCFVDSAGGFYLGGEFVYREYGKTICPSTKEQRDLLFQKMQESGYVWNADEKVVNMEKGK